jgi:DNA-binding transcriptional MocR family regulator
MQWQLPAGQQPPYLKIIDLIHHSLQTGTLLPGQKLPAERQLAQQLGVDRSTVQHAFNELVSRGILVRHVGSGTWVNADKWGVLPQGVRWQTYLTTNRLSDPDNFMVQLQQQPRNARTIDLTDGSLPSDLALTLDNPNFSLNEAWQGEQQVATSGAPALKQQLQQRLAGYLGQTPRREEWLITAGAQQAFFLITQGLLSFGDAIAVEAPSYFYQQPLFQAAGIRIFGVPLLANGGLNLARLEQLYYQQHIRLLLVDPTHQNPTGRTMPLAQRKALVAACRQLELPIVEDDPFGLSNAGQSTTPPPLKALDPANVLYVGSLSMVTGSQTRIGWLVAPTQVVTHLANMRQQMEAGLSIFPQLVATSLLAQPTLPTALQQLDQRLQQRQQLLVQQLRPLQQQGLLHYQIPRHGTLIWLHLTLPRLLAPQDYAAFLKADLQVLPGFLFGSQANTLRLSYARLATAQPIGQRLRQVLTDLV